MAKEAVAVAARTGRTDGNLVDAAPPGLIEEHLTNIELTFSCCRNSTDRSQDFRANFVAPAAN
jgi:hypothetical protein